LQALLHVVSAGQSATQNIATGVTGVAAISHGRHASNVLHDDLHLNCIMLIMQRTMTNAKTARQLRFICFNVCRKHFQILSSN
jgi:hypothetical protein